MLLLLLLSSLLLSLLLLLYALFSTFNWDGDGFHHSKEVKSKTNGKSGWKFLQLTCSTGATKWVWIWAITMIICTSRCIRTLIPKINYLSILARFPSLVASILLYLPVCLLINILSVKVLECEHTLTHTMILIFYQSQFLSTPLLWVAIYFYSLRFIFIC